MQNIESKTIDKLKSRLVDAFYNWIKLKLPDQAVSVIPTQQSQLLNLVFVELDNKDENLEVATNCVIELIKLAKKKTEFQTIKDTVVSKIETLMHKVDLAVAERD